MRTIQLAPALLCHHQELERHRQCLGPAARSRTVAKLDSMGLLVRRCFQCSAGKSKKVSKASLSLMRQSTAFSYLGENSATKASMPRSAWARVSAYMISCSARLARLASAGELV